MSDLDLKGVIPYTDSIHSFAIKILQKHDRAMSVTEITEKIQRTKKIRSDTPKNSVSAVLRRSEYIQPTQRGFYRLKKKYAKIHLIKNAAKS